MSVSVHVDPTTGDIAAEQLPELTANVAFDLLSNARRRYVLCFLRERGEASVRELSRYTAAWENDVEPTAVSSAQRKRVYTALHQTHLPRLDEYGIIEYDPDRGSVTPQRRLDLLEEYLQQPDDRQPNWHRYYLGIGLAATVLALGIIAELPVLETVQPGVAALVVGTAVVVGAGIHASTLARRVSPSFPDLRPPNEPGHGYTVLED
jgi:DNA-binding transcriptional ArsR family regulator